MFMERSYVERSSQGKRIRVPSICVRDQTVVTAGTLIKIAAIHDEEWQEEELLPDPESFVQELKNRSERVDLFTFSEKLPQITPRYSYFVEWDNVAAMPITSYKDWWENRIEYDVRKAVKKAAKLGVVVKTMPYDDAFVEGIKSIYDEAPMRQGKRFWHYGKDIQTIKAENGTYLDRSEYIGAYHQNEMIGFIKMVYVGKVGSTMQVISKQKHHDKRPTNALIAKAVELCEEKGMSYFVYAKYSYGSGAPSTLTEFKRRNGFESMPLPRYYVPLTPMGHGALAVGLHLGVRNLLPDRVSAFLLKLRSKLHAHSGPAVKSIGNRAKIDIPD